MFYIKLENNEGSEIKISDNQVCGKCQQIKVFSRLDDFYSNTSLFSPSSTQALLFQSSGTIFMDINLLPLCIEGFLYGNISVLFFTLYPCKRSPINPWSRTLFRIISHIFSMPIERVHWQDDDHRFICYRSSIHSIDSQLCQ